MKLIKLEEECHVPQDVDIDWEVATHKTECGSYVLVFSPHEIYYWIDQPFYDYINGNDKIEQYGWGREETFLEIKRKHIIEKL